MAFSFVSLFLVILLVSLLLLDILRKVTLLNKAFLCVYFVFAPHLVVLVHLWNRQVIPGGSIFFKWFLMIFAILFITYVWLKFNIAPNRANRAANLRLRIMIGGRTLIYFGLYALSVQTLLYVSGLFNVMGITVPKHIFIIDIVVTVLSTVILPINGMLRITYTARRLGILKRIVVFSLLFIPVVNIFAMLYACHIAAMEYDHECYKVIQNNERAESAVCKTRYPLVLVHGVGFRDLKYINYWGRIPKELIRNGATVYYGNQEAWGTIEYNAQDIKNKILHILKETGAEKVNIIAHSKGGLDSRYLISKLDMADCVATLTCMSSPHRGCKFVDLACKIPEKVYKAIAAFFDKRYKSFGDKNPDFYTASRQFATAHSKRFNEDVRDAEQVYYQSYASVMKSPFSDYILTIPYILARITDGENDGLVSVDSAKWGEFKGVLKNKYRRGISHGDIIDLRRDDYKKFDVIEHYVKIVSELKASGF